MNTIGDYYETICDALKVVNDLDVMQKNYPENSSERYIIQQANAYIRTFVKMLKEIPVEEE